MKLVSPAFFSSGLAAVNIDRRPHSMVTVSCSYFCCKNRNCNRQVIYISSQKSTPAPVHPAKMAAHASTHWMEISPVSARINGAESIVKLVSVGLFALKFSTNLVGLEMVRSQLFIYLQKLLYYYICSCGNQ